MDKSTPSDTVTLREMFPEVNPQDGAFSIGPLGPGPRQITEAPEVVSLSNPFAADVLEPAALRRDFWTRFSEITKAWPKTIETAEGPITWSKSKTGDKLRSFKDGEPALLHFIASANLPTLLQNSRLSAVEPETKGDRTVQEVHRRYAWADFPNGQRRHVLLTVERPSIHAHANRQFADHAYSSEVLGVSLEVLGEKESANVVNLKPGENSASSSKQAVTSAQEEFNRFQAGIKQEHRWRESSFSIGPAKVAGIHTQKGREWFRARGLQLPKEGTPRGNRNLHTEADLVKESENPSRSIGPAKVAGILSDNALGRITPCVLDSITAPEEVKQRVSKELKGMK